MLDSINKSNEVIECDTITTSMFSAAVLSEAFKGRTCHSETPQVKA